MSVNTVIVISNVVMASCLVALGLGLFLKSIKRAWEWPVTAGIALSGPFLAAGLVIAQLALFRTFDFGFHMNPNGYGTMTLRIVGAILSAALVWRVYGDTLLTERDRERGGDG